LAALNPKVVGFYNTETPVTELLIEITRVFPALRRATSGKPETHI